jgi:hypothetical protein
MDKVEVQKCCLSATKELRERDGINSSHHTFVIRTGKKKK